ncbi:hypothetical protein LTR86_007929 [Recurvomyces mirabilis]|nr:hypothetical protein LTR86_007929 [Recurvomyces mirabilis]
MDLSAMLNDGPAEKKQSQNQISPERQNTQRSIPPTPGANGLPSGYPQSQTTPLYAPPPGAPLSRQTTGLTPLRTPSQGPPGSQYPFPHQTSQSPAVQQPTGGYSHYGTGPATTPGPRPSSHSYPSYAQPSPGQHALQGHPPGVYALQSSSHSPTPSSHHGQTPQSLRQSPLSAMSHAPPPVQHHPQYAHQHSQPSTPLGPPPLQYSRTSGQNFHDAQSPYHQRQLSGASNGMTVASPAQHQPSIGNLLDSPSGYTRQSPHLRRTSDYLSQMDRERSVSVSPKTKVLPRALSQTSRQSSQQEVPSARSSLQHQHSVASLLESPSHVTTHSQSAAAQPSHIVPQSQQPHGVTQAIPPFSATGQPPLAQSSLSKSSNHSQLPIQHQPQRMDMNHLLTPASSVTSTEGQENMAPKRKPQEAYQFMRPSPKPKRSNVAPPPAPVQPTIQQQQSDDLNGHDPPEVIPKQNADSREVNISEQRTASETIHKQQPRDTHMIDARPTSTKRPAETEPSSEPPAKRGRSGRKYADLIKPIWARLSPKNPMYNAKEDGVSNGHAQQHAPPPAPVQQRQQQPRPNAQVQQPVNGQRSQDDNYFPPGVDPERPWADDPPLNRDLMQMQHCLSLQKWEKSLKYHDPMPDMQRCAMDWLYREMSQLKDIPHDKRIVEIEIEGKIGRIMKGDERLSMPILTSTVLSEDYAQRNLRFESKMEIHEHKAMNDFLNTELLASRSDNRVPMEYSHPKTIDSFKPLSAAGFQALPPSFKRHCLHNSKDLKLRTTTDQTTGAVTARIVKHKISDLHIFSPQGEYDCRISLNLEAKLMPPPHDPNPPEELMTLPSVTEMGDEWLSSSRVQPDREKDRLSYKHQIYQIDLTKVGAEKGSYELEIEVDAEVLREQMERMEQGRENGFAGIVEGFLNNATFLTRQRA